MNKIKKFTKSGFEKIKKMVNDEIRERKELKEKIENMSDEELKELVIRKGQPYHDEYIKRQRNRKRLEKSLKDE